MNSRECGLQPHKGLIFLLFFVLSGVEELGWNTLMMEPIKKLNSVKKKKKGGVNVNTTIVYVLQVAK